MPLTARAPLPAAALFLSLLLVGCSAEHQVVAGQPTFKVAPAPTAAPPADDAGATTDVPEPTAYLDTVADRLDAQVRRATRRTDARVAVVVSDPGTGRVLSRVRPREVFLTASVYKLFLAGATLEAVGEGRLAPGTPVPWHGCPTVEQALWLSIVHSHNECSLALADTLGWNEVAAHVERAGLQDTVIGAGNPTTTAADVAGYLTRLHRGELLDEDGTERLLDLLGQQAVRHTMFPTVPEGTTWAHKTGTFDHLAHDVGLLTSADRTLVVVVLSDGWGGYGVTEGRTTFDALGEAAVEALRGWDEP